MTRNIRHLVGAAGAALYWTVGAPAAADVDVHVHVPAPVVVLPAPPPMVWLPGPRIYIAHGAPHRIFFNDDRYYLFHDDVWFVGPGYGGPWARIKIKQVPPGLRKFKARDWDGWQREAGRHARGGHPGHPNFVGWKDDNEKRAHQGGKHGGNPGKGRGKDK
jgi:hypothetical protein